MKKKTAEITKIEFKNLADNAFDFLEKAINQIKQEPKYSVINYYSALELFFKARLLKEHWTLILTNPATADFNQFRVGDFHSVSLETCAGRIVKVCGERQFDEHMMKCFEKIRDHRNQLVHFHNKGYSDRDRKIIESVMTEQLRGWFYIYEILTKKWHEYFIDYTEVIERIYQSLHDHREFLRKKFANLKQRIDGEQNSGRAYLECPSCDFESLRRGDGTGPLVKYNCLVCDYNEPLYSCECPECQQQFDFVDISAIQCSSCNRSISTDEFCKMLKHEDSEHLIEEFSCSEMLCDDCMTNDVIQTIDGNYLCLNCNSFHDSSSQCSFCNQPYLGRIDDEHSRWHGCHMCDGEEGYHQDKGI